MPAFSAQSRNISLVVAAAFFMQMLDGVIIVTALPAMAADFRVDTLAMSIGVTVYMLTTAVLIPAAGWLADRFGARRVFITAIAVFTLASLACGIAEDLTQFVLARAVQGAGGAMMFPVGRVLVLRSADKHEIVSAIGLTVWPALFAPVIGPALGGFITTYLDWRWNFFLNIPLGIAGVLLVWVLVPRDGKGVEQPFDWLGFGLTALALSALLVGFETLAHGTVPPVAGVVLAAIGLVTGILAILWLRRTAFPVLRLQTLGIRTFAAAELWYGSWLRITIHATPFLLPLLFQLGFGLDPLAAGGLVMAYFLGNLVMKSITTRILRRFGFRNVLVVNGTLAAISIAICGLMTTTTPYAVIVLVLVIAGMTRSMQLTALATIAFADVDAEARSSASTLSSMFQQLTLVIGIALATGMLNGALAVTGASAVGLGEFRIAFLLMGALALVGALAFTTLPRDAGAEVSGHRVPG